MCCSHLLVAQTPEHSFHVGTNWIPEPFEGCCGAHSLLLCYNYHGGSGGHARGFANVIIILLQGLVCLQWSSESSPVHVWGGRTRERRRERRRTRRRERKNPFSSLHRCLCNAHLRIFTHLTEALQPFDTYCSSHTHTHTHTLWGARWKNTYIGGRTMGACVLSR